MWKLLSMPLFFFRELIFESKEEYDINSTYFNTKKVLAFSILILSIILNVLLVIRVVSLAVANLDLKEALDKAAHAKAEQLDKTPTEVIEVKPTAKKQ